MDGGKAEFVAEGSSRAHFLRHERDLPLKASRIGSPSGQRHDNVAAAAVDSRPGDRARDDLALATVHCHGGRT